MRQWRQRSLQRLARTLLRFVVVVSLTLVVGEAVMWIIDPARELKFRTDPDVYWRYRPSQSGYVWGGLEQIRSPLIRINEDGIRDHDRVAAEEGRVAILAVGDSYTFGWGIEEEAAFVAIAESALGAPVRVINAGVPGYGVFQMVETAKRLLPLVRPRVLLVTLLTGDVYRQPIDDPARRAALLRDYEWRARADSSGRFIGLLYRGASRIYGSLRGDSIFLPTQVEVTDAAGFRPWWQRDEERLRELTTLTRAAGVPLVVLAWPNWREGSYAGLSADSDAIVAAGLQKLEHEVGLIPLLDLGRRLQAYPLSELTIPIDDHPSPLAHRVAGEYLAEALKPLLLD